MENWYVIAVYYVYQFLFVSSNVNILKTTCIAEHCMFVQIRKRHEEKIKCKDLGGVVHIIEQSWYKIQDMKYKMCKLLNWWSIYFSFLRMYMSLVYHGIFLHNFCISISLFLFMQYNLYFFTTQNNKGCLHPARVSALDSIVFPVFQVGKVLHEIINSSTFDDGIHISHSWRTFCICTAKRKIQS